MKIICDECQTEFERRTAEVNRSRKLGRKQFCSRTCTGKNLFNIPVDRRSHPENLVASNRRDEFSGFRKHLRCIKRRDPSSNLTLQDLKDLWEKQEPICPITGQSIFLRTYRGKSRPAQASVDRIDSSKGYTLDNIQWVSLLANVAKNHWDEHEVRVFFNPKLDDSYWL